MIMKYTSKLLAITAIGSGLIFAACEESPEISETVKQEDSIAIVATIPPPTLRAIETNIPTIVKFELRVAASQVQDTAHYLVLEADSDIPTREALLTHEGKTELPMAGNYSRTLFEPNLKEETEYSVYAVIKKNRDISEIASVDITTGTSE